MAVSQAAISLADISAHFSNLTSVLIFPVIFLVGIGGTRSFSGAIERGELSRQLVDQHSSRVAFIGRKYLSFYVLSVIPLLLVDFIFYLDFEGYYFLAVPFQEIGTNPSLFMALVVLEQLLLLFFLDSLVLALSLFLKRTTVVLFAFLAFSFLGIYFYVTTPQAWATALQLGYGDWSIVNSLGEYLQYGLSFGFSGPFLPILPNSFYVGVVYRLLGGLILLILSLAWFRRVDLD